MFDLLCAYRGRKRRAPGKVVYLAGGAGDFPLSRHDDLIRVVINPQNRHILGDAKPRAGGLRDANRFDRNVAILTSRLRTSLQSSATRHIQDVTFRLAILCKIAHHNLQGSP